VGENATVVVRMRANPRPYFVSWTAGDDDLDRERFNQRDVDEQTTGKEQVKTFFWADFLKIIEK
jgi:hypothetical protein